jgi:glycosyltransferase involved in cell wall biosynthesis
MIENELSRRLEESKALEPAFSDLSEKNAQVKYDISVVVPTRNEAGNIEPLLSRIDKATKGIPTEVVFVDDSTDDTPQVIMNNQGRFSLKVVLIARPPEARVDGLGGAVVEGFRKARAPWVCVMDADLQHPPELIPQLYRHAQINKADIVVGSRLAAGGDASSLGFKRTLISRLFATVTRIAFPVRLGKVTDPLSGFFIVRRTAVNLDILRPDGFKILLEILVRCPDLRVSEMPIHFGHRLAGESKASLLETIRFSRLLLRLRLEANQSFIRFLVVGVSGLFVNSLILAAFTEFAGLYYLVSAVVATQASTLWNFGLTEAWVFGKRKSERPFLIRLVGYLFMNNLLLLLRAPLLALMVSKLGIHYLISNLVSLFSLMLIRYFIADKWLWTEASTVRSSQNRILKWRISQMFKIKRKPATDFEKVTLNPKGPSSLPFVYSYNIHNILRVASMFELPELEYFRVPDLLGEPDIRLRLERRHKERRRQDKANTQKISENKRQSSQRRFESLIHYKEIMGRLGFEVSIGYKECVEVAVSPILKLSLHVLYTNIIEPILRWSLVRKGYALVHAACIAVDGRAVLITARTDTGKTSTILRAVDNYHCSFLSDDMTIVSKDGQVLSYPKPLTISNHTLKAVSSNSTLSILERISLQLQSRLHSKSGRRVGMKLSDSKLPAATMNTVVQMLIPPPKYMVHRLIPKVTYATQATLSRAVIIERGLEFEEALSPEQALEVFINNGEDAYGFPPYPILASSLSRWEEKDLHPAEQAIIAEALKQIPTIRLRDPKFNWWQRLPVITDSFPSATNELAAVNI